MAKSLLYICDTFQMSQEVCLAALRLQFRFQRILEFHFLEPEKQE